MFKQLVILGAIGMMSTTAVVAAETPIVGNVSSKCSIFTDTPGVYGNPTPDELSTLSADGGIDPVVRYDVTVAHKYKAKISWPNSFTSSPSLTDVVNWDGETVVKSHSVSGMSAYEAAKVEYENHTEFDLTLAGSTWFSIESEAKYGSAKSLPGGEYKASVVAECIAK